MKGKTIGSLSPLSIVDSKTSRRLIDTDHLKSKTQKQAFTLLQREDNNGKKSRLEMLLIQQFVTKYGVKAAHSPVNACIKEAVRDFLSDFVNARDAEAQIPSLEKEVAEKTSLMRETLAEARRQEQKQREEAQRLQQQLLMQQASQSVGSKVRGGGNVQVSSIKDLPQEDWVLVQSALEAETEARRKQQEVGFYMYRYGYVLTVWVCVCWFM
ncbi:hypothetical protein EON64_10755 [archaeon]|nr:MAG: hypothetical protein EON64_10755 [archaeon]